MKTIIYVLIAIFAFGIIANGFKGQSQPKNSILIQSTDNKISSATLSQSASIISGRLQSFSSNKFNLKLIPEKNQIQVIFADNSDLKTVEGLLTKQGTFAFYATYDQKQLAELLKDDNQLNILLSRKNTNPTSSEIGCVPVGGVEKVNKYLATLALNQSCKFVWSQPDEKKGVCLYALQLENGKGAILNGSDIAEMKSNQEKDSGSYVVGIEFKQPAIAIWADATRRNINHAIAIVLDDQVLYAPTLRSVIEGGRCEISGNFTQTEGRYLAALGNNGALPVSFKVVR